jgi:hypothetical protein
VQTGPPLPQPIEAVAAQGFCEVQAWPAAQAAHTPLPLQTPVTAPSVHAVPAARGGPSTQTGVPPEQSSAPDATHGLDGAHAAPWTQATHAPAALQNPLTPPEVHGVPAALKVSSVQTGAPVPQAIAAVAAQGLLEVQLAPALQATQAPAASHTPVVAPSVQAVPAVR